jgi:hypothetical protein
MPTRDATSVLGLTVLLGCASPPPSSPPSPVPPVDAPPVHLPLAPPAPIAPRASATADVTALPPPRDQLDPAAIQRVIRQNFGSFRRCYEEYISQICCPNLQNRVTVRFVIGRDGSVKSAVDAGSELPNGRAITCIVDAMAALNFPAPKGGPITVTYPITFGPGDG